MEFERKNLLDDWDGEDCWGNWAWENCSGLKRNSGDFSNRDCKSASKNCVAALCRPRSCVPTVLDESGKRDTLRKHGLVPDNMITQIVDWWWIYLVDVCWHFYF